MIHGRRVLLAALLFISIFSIFIAPSKAYALSGSDFRAGNIIENFEFFNGSGMTVSEIQAFLNAQVPTCDTWGTKMFNSTQTRAQYGTSVGNPPPYICVRNYYENPTTHETNFNSTAAIPSGAISAAQIIYNAAQTYNINPKALLVTLKKEAPLNLIGDDWPFASEYRAAMGYGCPDTAPCDAQYYGFYNQMTNAARQFRLYAQNPASYRYKALQNNFIQYNPSSACGGSYVYIENQATAGLYNYTPYQPNASALNNLYGLGDGCGAYGNRNFWVKYNEWFNPYETVRSGITMTTITQPITNPSIGETVSYSFSLTNKLNGPITFDAVGVVGRKDNPYTGENRDFGWQGPITLQAGETQTFNFTERIKDAGTLYSWPAIHYQSAYIHYNNWGSSLTAHNPNLTLSTPWASPVSSVVAGQTVEYETTVKNNEPRSITLDSIGLSARYYGVYVYDSGWTALPTTLAPGASYTIKTSINFDKVGPYTVWPAWKLDTTFQDIASKLNYSVQKAKADFGLSYIEMPNQNPALGEDVVVKFKLKNNVGVPMKLDAVGVVGRYDSPYTGKNRDFGWVGPETFAPYEEKSYTTFVSSVSELKTFYCWVAIVSNGTYIHYNNWGFMLTPHFPSLSLSSPVSINGGVNPVLGQSSTITATVKNNEPHTIRLDKLGIAGLYYGRYVYDATWTSPAVLNASGTTGDSLSLSGSIIFDKHGPYTIWASATINGISSPVGTTSTLNL